MDLPYSPPSNNECFLSRLVVGTDRDHGLGGEAAMHGALLGDLEELCPLLVAQRPVEPDAQLDPIDLPLFGLAFGAIVGMDLRVLETSGDTLKRQTFPLGVHREGYRGARP